MTINDTNMFRNINNENIAAIFDNLTFIKELDKGKMFNLVYNLPEQMEEALSILENFKLSRFENKLSYVIITGVGGSAIAGDLTRVLLSKICNIPILINRDYVLPAFIGDDTLVIASSYSGDTEETLSAYQIAKEKNAKIIAITSGGTLGKLALKDIKDAIIIPGGLSPRAAIGYSLISLLYIFSSLGLVGDMKNDIKNAINLLKQLREQLTPEVPIQNNQAKNIAQKLIGNLPVIYGSTGTTEVIAQRWKSQICENAKTIAYNNTFPELNHNEIVGSEYPIEIINKMSVILLRDKEDYKRNKLRMNITSDILEGKVDQIIEVSSVGESALERMLSLVMIGDYLSLYLSIAYGKDPTPIERISTLKDKLSKH